MSYKVLYIGNWKDGGGWSTAAQNAILAMDSVGIDVVPRHVTSSDTSHRQQEIPERLLELEQKRATGCDICIQHLLPHMMEYDGHFKLNIGRFDYETSNFNHTYWARHLNTMDHIFVSNPYMQEVCKNSNVTTPTSVIPHCFDISKYSQYYKDYEIPALKDQFVFYTIGEVIRRKNLAGLIKAFHLEFRPYEPVTLLIKGHMMGLSPAETNEKIKKLIEEIKRGLRLYPNITDYHNEVIITQWMKDEEILRLHKTCDCFVSASYGEAWNIPGFEAMAMGKPVILNNEGGPKYYIENLKSGLLLRNVTEEVFMPPSEIPVDGIWTGDESWHKPSVQHLRQLMRKIYQDEEIRCLLGNHGIDRAYDFSYNIVGNLINNTLQKLLDITNER
jgi:glycosyltransferase involved in cell wall biosynthesis